MRSPCRVYQSTLRRQQADETRTRIVEAARGLLQVSGYTGMTVEAIAREAGVSPQTVYAAFGSKQGILGELIFRAICVEQNVALHEEILRTSDPDKRVRLSARMARQIFESESPVLDLLHGAGVLGPELAKLRQDGEAKRYEGQAPIVKHLHHGGWLKPELTVTRARDLFWALTSRDLYRMLVQERGWSPLQYENWLATALVDALAARPARSS